MKASGTFCLEESILLKWVLNEYGRGLAAGWIQVAKVGFDGGALVKAVSDLRVVHKKVFLSQLLNDC